MYYKGEYFRQQKQHVSSGVHSDSLRGCKTIWGRKKEQAGLKNVNSKNRVDTTLHPFAVSNVSKFC